MVQTQTVTVLPLENEAMTSAEQEIHQAREQLSQTATQIQAKVRTDFSWQRVVARHPLTLVGIAVGAGAFMGFATAPKSMRISPSPTDTNPQADFWTPLMASAVSYAVRSGSKYLIDRVLNYKNSPPS
jgi:hypothetical protein